MLLGWKIRYIDTRDKEFKDRDLWLDTDTLKRDLKAAVELCHELRDTDSRGIVRYRPLFREGKQSGGDLIGQLRPGDTLSSFCVPDYFEDELGHELSFKRMAAILTGDPSAVMFPSSARQHDVEYALVEKPPLSVDQIVLADSEVDLLGTFCRDLDELRSSKLFREGPGTLSTTLTGEVVLRTVATDAEIRSFVTIFRRLHMENEPANLSRAAAVVAKALDKHPLGRWIAAEAGAYEATLQATPFGPVPGGHTFGFSRKRVIDVYLYTQYAHQPDERRTRQFLECLAAVGGRRPVLDWMFLMSLWECSVHVHNAGVMVRDVLRRYCEVHAVSPAVLAPLAHHNQGLGSLETKEEKRERLFGEKAGALAEGLWRDAGCPEEGPARFLTQARRELHASLGEASVGEPG